MCPQETLKRGKVSTPATPPRVGPRTQANPQPTRVGNRGSRGAKPPWRGAVGGVPPQNRKKGRVARFGNSATSGTQNAGEPSANEGWAIGGPGGEAPMAGGCGGCPPTKPKEGASSPLWKLRHEWDPKLWQTLSLRGWAKRGSRGRSPLAGGHGGCPPTNSKEGASCHISNPATSGTQNAGEPSANEGGQTGVQGAKPHGRGLGGCAPSLTICPLCAIIFPSLFPEGKQ
jgi:hypothetical protein